MTLDFEVRTTRRPLPRQLEVSSDWSSSSSNEAAKATAASGSSSLARGAAVNSVASPQGRLAARGAFPPSYSAKMPVNRYDVTPPVNNQDEWRYSKAPGPRTSYTSASFESDRSLESRRFSSFSTAASDEWKPREGHQNVGSWDASSMGTSASSEHRRLSSYYSRQKPSKDDDDSRDNQREDERIRFAGRRDSFVDVSPLRYQREEMASTRGSRGHYRKENSFAAPSKSMSASPRGNRPPGELNQERPFFSPFRLTESTSSTSPDSRAESEDRDSESYQRFLSRRHMGDNDSDSESESKTHDSFMSSSRLSADGRGSENGVKTRRVLFPPPPDSPISVTPSDFSKSHGQSSPPTLSPSSPSKFVPVARTSPMDSRARIEPTSTAAAKPSSDPIASMVERREELYSFRKKMREVFARVDEMVDAHREYFKSDPGSGTPIFDSEAAKEAERLADVVFADLADLRERFQELATDFKDSEAKDKAARLTKGGVTSASSAARRVRKPQSVMASDDGETDSSNDDGSAETRTISALSSSKAQRQPSSSPNTLLNNAATNASAGSASASNSSSPMFASSRFHNHTEEEQEEDGEVTRSTVFSEDDGDDDAVSAAMNDNFSQLSARMGSRMTPLQRYSTSSSLQSKSSETVHSSKGDRSEDGNVFQGTLANALDIC